MVHVTIVGTGDEAHALAHLYHNYNSATSGNKLEVTKPHVLTKGNFHDTGVPIAKLDDALYRSKVVILAIPASALKTFVSDNFDLLRDKILVDVSNSFIPGEDLNSILSMTNVRFVKAFNDLGAVDILLDKPSSKTKIPSKMCSKYPEAVAIVKAFAEESLGLEMKVIPYERYLSIEQHQESYGGNWIKAMWVVVFIFICAELYAVLRYNVFKGYDWFHLPLQVTNKAICWTSIYGFAISQLPGIFARMSNSIYGDSLRGKPQWMLSFLGMRKQLGLLSLWFLVVHIIMSLLLFNPAYYSKFFINSDGPAKLNAMGETSFFFGILAAAFYFILGICSLPSVGSQMTSTQWKLVYGPLAWIALIFATAHVLIMGAKGWTQQEKWPGGMPPITLTSTLVPLAVLTLKIAQVLSRRLVSVCYPPPSNDKYRKSQIIVPTVALDPNDDSDESSGSIPVQENALVTIPLYEDAEASSSLKSSQPRKIKKKRKSTTRQPSQTSVTLGDSFVINSGTMVGGGKKSPSGSSVDV